MTVVGNGRVGPTDSTSGPLVESDPTAPPPPRFRVSVGHALGTVLVTLHGAVDAEGIDQLQMVLDDAVSERGSLRRIVVDLRDARGVHPSVAATFTLAAERANQRGVTLELHGASRDFSRALLGGPSAL